MKLRFLGMAVVLAATSLAAQAPSGRGTVRTDSLWSQSLGVHKQVVVYLPPSYHTAEAQGRRYPMAVYLHGAWGSESDWTAQGRLAGTMDSLVAAGMPELIVVMPDGDDGWWTTWHYLIDHAACRRVSRRESPDTYCVPWPKYDDYVINDVVGYADATYRTRRDRASRAIAGLSMGGYGAISIAARSPETFAVAASHSGVLRPALMADSSGGAVVWRDARTTSELRTTSGAARWSIIQPAFGTDSVSWMGRDPTRLIARAKARGATLPVFFADVGTGDYLLAQNRSFRDAMQSLGVPLTYREWSGVHDWAYWRAHLAESLRFIATHLTAPAKK